MQPWTTVGESTTEKAVVIDKVNLVNVGGGNQYKRITGEKKVTIVHKMYKV